MSRTKIDYGIDLGTTNSAISRMENGEPIIKKLPQKDTMASCVAFNKKGILVGDKAHAAYRSEKESALSKKIEPNAFIEFKRTMGTNEIYKSEYGGDLSSEDLSSEILKSLKSFITDENFSSVVITVPAAFKNNQVDATRRAGKLAGFDHVEVLQEPVAASMAYGLGSSKKDGFWLVFDFGGGTFDSALVKVEDGIMKVVDTEGDNYLGGKNLDYAIVDKILIPHIKENFSINNILDNEETRIGYRDALKSYAEELKNELSFKDSYNLYKEDRCGLDDEGEEIEIDVTISQQEIESAISPIFQKSIDIVQSLLKRNNLEGGSLASLILVGGPTFSPILRRMLNEQISNPDTSVDPMTVVSKGAALYASTINISDEVREVSRDRTKIQIEIGHEATTVETEEFVTLKILEDKTEGEIPNTVYAEITRGDKAWSSGKVEINAIGEVIDTLLNEGVTNVFEVLLYDNKGNVLESEPSTFSIIQGVGGIDSMQTLPYNFGIEIKQKSTGKIVFAQVPGLERNKSLPLVGVKPSLKTQKQIRPGMDSDLIRIPLYQGEHNSEGTRAIYNEHVYDIVISGADLPALLPENSEVDVTVKINKSQNVTVEAYFPYLDHTAEIEIPDNHLQSVETSWLQNEIRKAKGSLEELQQDGSNPKLDKVSKDLETLEQSFNNNKNDVDGKQEVLTNLRRSLKVIDELGNQTEWPKLEESLKEEFYRLEKINGELGNDKSTEQVNEFRGQLDDVIRSKDVKLGNQLHEEIHSFFFQLTFIYQLIGFIQQHDEHFGSFNWRDSNKARTLLNRGKQIISENPDVDDLHPVIISLIDLLPMDERPSGDDSVLVG